MIQSSSRIFSFFDVLATRRFDLKPRPAQHLAGKPRQRQTTELPRGYPTSLVRSVTNRVPDSNYVVRYRDRMSHRENWSCGSPRQEVRINLRQFPHSGHQTHIRSTLYQKYIPLSTV